MSGNKNFAELIQSCVVDQNVNIEPKGWRIWKKNDEYITLNSGQRRCIQREYREYLKNNHYDKIKFLPTEQHRKALLRKAIESQALLTVPPEEIRVGTFVCENHRMTLRALSDLRHCSESNMRTRYIGKICH